MRSPRKLLPRAAAARSLVPALVAALVAGAAGAVQIDAIAMERGFGFDGQTWYFEAGLAGADLNPDSVASVVLDSDLGTGRLVLTHVGGNEYSATQFFASQEELLANFPNGSLTVSIDQHAGAPIVDQITYDPDFAPDGAARIDFVANGETNVALDVEFLFENTCLTCASYNEGFEFDPTPLFVTLFDRDDGNRIVASQAVAPDSTRFSTGFDLDEGTNYLFQTIVYSSEQTAVSFAGNPASMWELSTVLRGNAFTTVPEPGTLWLVAPGLALLARARRRRTRP